MLPRFCLVSETQNVFSFAVPDGDAGDGGDAGVGDGDGGGADGGDNNHFPPPYESSFGHRLQEEETFPNVRFSHLVSYLWMAKLVFVVIMVMDYVSAGEWIVFFRKYPKLPKASQIIGIHGTLPGIPLFPRPLDLPFQKKRQRERSFRRW